MAPSAEEMMKKDETKNVSTSGKNDGETSPTTTNAATRPGSSTERNKGLEPPPETESGDRSAEATDVDTSPSANAEEETPIGTKEDALHLEGTEPAPKKDAAEESKARQKRELLGSVPNEEKPEEAPITSLAQLRDYHIRRGTAPTTEERERVRALEQEIAEEGAKHHRLPAAERSKGAE